MIFGLIVTILIIVVLWQLITRGKVGPKQAFVLALLSGSMAMSACAPPHNNRTPKPTPAPCPCPGPGPCPCPQPK